MYHLIRIIYEAALTSFVEEFLMQYDALGALCLYRVFMVRTKGMLLLFLDG